MTKSTYLSKSVLISILGFLIFSIIFYLLPNEEKTFINFFTIFGFYVSLFGLSIALFQIRSLKNSSIVTQQAVEKSLQRISQLIDISHIAKTIKTIHEIQQYLIDKKLELALLRMKDTKTSIIQLKSNRFISKVSSDTEYNDYITSLGSDINAIQDVLFKKNVNINLGVISSNLENISTILIELENQLKK